MGDILLVERVGSVAMLTLNRPQAGNSVNAELSCALEKAMTRLLESDGLQALVIRGVGGRFFCTGGDIKEYRALIDPAALEEVFGRMRRVLDALEAFPAPVIAAVEGHALGGGMEIALACDYVVAGETARFGLPQVKLGIVPGWDGIERLVRLCGRRRALRLVSTGESLDAAGALAFGVADEIVPGGTALEAALARAASCASAAPLALAQAKRLASLAMRADPSLREESARAFSDLWFSADHREAEAAFAEKRAPRFRGA